MSQEQNPFVKQQNKNYIEKLRAVKRIKPEILDLVEEDLEYGLTVKQTKLYMDSDLDVKQMKVYSMCLRNDLPEEVIKILTDKKLSNLQMEVAYEFYDKGLPLHEVQVILDRNDTPVAMKAAYQKVLERLQKEKIQLESKDESIKEEDEKNKQWRETQEDPDYVKAIMEQMKAMVEKIQFQEKYYDDLKEKLATFETTKKDEEVRENLLSSLDEKDRMINDQQDKINLANTTIARLRTDLEEKEREVKKLQGKISDLEIELDRKDARIQSLKYEKSNQELNHSIKKSEEKDRDKEKMNSQDDKQERVGQAAVIKGIPVDYNAMVTDTNGKIVPLQAVEKEIKKSSGVVSLISKILFKKKSRQDIVRLVTSGELIPEQLVMIRLAIEKGLKESQLVDLINSKVSAELMKEIIEIAVLENSIELEGLGWN